MFETELHTHSARGSIWSVYKGFLLNSVENTQGSWNKTLSIIAALAFRRSMVNAGSFMLFVARFRGLIEPSTFHDHTFYTGLFSIYQKLNLDFSNSETLVMKNKVITFGEIMLRLATPSFQRFSQARNFETSYGGSEANVAASLAIYGVDTCFVSRLPNNDIAKACEMELKKYGVNTQSIVWGGERLGSYFLETGAVNRSSKVIYDRAYSAFSQIQPGMINWNEVFEDATWFHWTGITPAVSQGAADACLEAIKIARGRGVTVSCDLNYRKNLWTYGKQAHEVMPVLVEETDIVLANDEAAEKMLQIKPEVMDIPTGHGDAAAYKKISEELVKHFPNVKKVITTLRTSLNANHNKWSGALYDGKTFFQTTEYDITHIVDRVGGGDAFMGGFIYGLLTYKEDKKALDFAVAASCLKHTIHGDFNLATVNEVEALMKGDTSGRVQR